MALAERKQALRALSHERRRHQRVKVSLVGRYMLADRREFPCQVVDMSPGGIAVIAPVVGKIGDDSFRQRFAFARKRLIACRSASAVV